MKRRPWAFALLALAVPALGQADGPAAALRGHVRAWRKGHEKAILREYVELLAIPNLATDAVNIQKNAERIAALLERRGVKTRLLDGEGGPPVVRLRRSTTRRNELEDGERIRSHPQMSCGHQAAGGRT